jgi:hypothetical protein
VRQFIKVGDRVRMLEDYESLGKSRCGVIIYAEQHGCCIKFDETFDKRLHGGASLAVLGDFAGEPNRCWNIASRDGEFSWQNILVVLQDGENAKSNTKEIINYEAGTSIASYIDEIAKDCADKDRLKWLKTFQNCVLPKHAKEAIEEALIVVLLKNKFDEWGINEHFEKGITNSILLYGPPGVGKSMVSESIAAVLGKNLMKIDTATIQSNVPGQTERNIKKSFEDATSKNCVLLLDECDSLLTSRDYAGIILGAEINCLLTEIERFDGVVLLTTNRINRLDQALARRIIAKIELALPDEETRREIWKKLMPEKMPLSADIDFDLLAAYEISGGEIKNAILLAARKAIAKNQAEVTMQNFIDSLSLVKNGADSFQGKKSNLSSVESLVANAMSHKKNGSAGYASYKA